MVMANLELGLSPVRSGDEQVEMREELARVYRPDLSPHELPSFIQDPLCLADFSVAKLKIFMPRLALAVCWYYTCVYVNNLSQAWLQANMTGFYESNWGYSQPNSTAAAQWLRRHEPEVYKARYGDLDPSKTGTAALDHYHNQTLILFDVVFLYTPKLDTSLYADCFAGISSLIGLVRYVVIPGPLSLRWTWLIRLFFVWGTLFLFRAFTIVATPLPNPYHECVPKITFPDNIWLEAFANLPGVFWWSELTCQDVLFSGHTAMGTTFTLFNWRYLKRAPWLGSMVRDGFSWERAVVDIGACIWLCWGWYVIAASHFHYTVDVMVGAMLSFTVYNFYHRWIESIWVEMRVPFRKPFTKAIRWLERPSPDLAYLRKCMSEARTSLRAPVEVSFGWD